MRIVNGHLLTSQLLKNVNISYKVKSFIAPDGEHFSQLYVEGEGFPLFYPTAYCSRSLRPRHTHATQKEHLFAIKKLYEWANTHNIDLHMRLESRTFFSAQELDSLLNNISVKKNARNGEAIVGTKVNACLAAISSFLVWHADEVITDSNRTEVHTAIDNMSNAIKARNVRQGSAARQTQRILEQKISNEMRATLDLIFRAPISHTTKQADQGPAYRNALALRILYDTGMRVGELLSLTLRDFHLGTGGDPTMLEIRRNHDDPFDDRLRQPVAKTVGRYVPISDELADMLSTYLKNWRREVPGVGFENHDFILITHRKGKRQGKALEYSSLESGIANLQKKHPTLRGIHPHLLRHDWNYRFSLLAS